jgi:hypothetical protein
MAATARPTRRLDVNSELLPDRSMILFDPLNTIAYPLSESAALVWHACDGNHTAAEIADALAVVYEASDERIAHDVEALLQHLVDIGLLEPTLERGAPR